MKQDTDVRTGATYSEDLVPDASVLVCKRKDIKHEKRLFAARHKIPTVLASWLWDSLKAGKTQPVQNYLLDTKIPDNPTVKSEEVSSKERPKTLQPKNEGSRGNQSTLYPPGQGDCSTYGAPLNATHTQHEITSY